MNVHYRLHRMDASTELAEDAFRRSVGWEDFRNKSVASLGEGFSGLLPCLVTRSSAKLVVGVDPCYQARHSFTSKMWTFQLMTRYLARWSHYLLSADAGVLPFSDGTFDVVLSHRMVDTLSRERFQQLIRELHRVLRPGGEARLAYGHAQERGHLQPKRLREWLRRELSDLWPHFVLRLGCVTAARSLPDGADFPSDSMPWREFQDALFGTGSTFPRHHVARTLPFEELSMGTATLFLLKA